MKMVLKSYFYVSIAPELKNDIIITLLIVSKITFLQITKDYLFLHLFA